jgi:hypothetical protein
VPADVPPQLPVYHFQLADVPRLPPLTLSVRLPPRQNVEEPEELIEIAGTDVSFTVIVMLLQMLLLQVPSARTKYVVVTTGLTVKVLPVPAETPPQLPLYHLQVAEVPNTPPFIDKVVLLPLQIVDEVAVAEVAGTDVSLTVMDIF